jgi:hypothetical protein
MKTLSRRELNDLVVRKAMDDPKYREQLIQDPKTALSKLLGWQLPANVTVKAVQEAADTYYVVVPHVPGEDTELSDTELERVAGGWKPAWRQGSDGGVEELGRELESTSAE